MFIEKWLQNIEAVLPVYKLLSNHYQTGHTADYRADIERTASDSKYDGHQANQADTKRSCCAKKAH